LPTNRVVAVRLGQWLFHQITDKDYAPAPDSGFRDPETDERSDELFVARMGGHLDFAGKSVLDVGCGFGSLCGLAARSGATEVLGVDLNVDGAERRIEERFADVADRIEFRVTPGGLGELGDRQFDLVISKDSMEHFPEPEAFVQTMVDRVRPGGQLSIGFSPTWKSPWGGHIDYMTKFPWAHLIFSERTIMAERRRFRPDEHAESFAEVKGGLNKMTYSRFYKLMTASGLEPTYLETNVGDGRALKLMRLPAKVPPLRDYFTVGVYSVWTRPAAA
jgi:SAM-dependent methyltransferase